MLGVHFNAVFDFDKDVGDSVCEHRVSVIRYFFNAMLIIIENI